MRIPRRASSLLAAALVVGTNTASMGGPAPRRPASEPAFTGPVVERVGCPTSRGLGVASHPGPAVAVARRFLLAQRARSPEVMATTADRWFRHRVAPRDAGGFRTVYPRIRPGSDAWWFRLRHPRWLDAHFGPIGPYLNARLKLLDAGVQAYSCPHRVIHRLVRAIWWIQVVLPRCDCDPDRVLDLLVVRRNGRYGVFGLA
jgi:hypothetical protein